jgi:hypothetical protein
MTGRVELRKKDLTKLGREVIILTMHQVEVQIAII